MLVITREVGESLVIGDNIRVMVTQARGGQAKIGISAPKDVRIVRAECDMRTDSLLEPDPVFNANAQCYIERT